MGLVGHDINFVFLSDRKIRSYNKKYLKHDWATDVIAFPMKRGKAFGDILVSLDTARRQAKEHRHSILKEVKILSIHGLLHLKGYDDKKKKDRERMWRKTDKLLQKIESY